MNGSESEEAFVEKDHQETQLGYGDGKVPLYVGAIWVIFILTYLGVMYFLALPDLRSWSTP